MGYRDFYTKQYAQHNYANNTEAKKSAFYPDLERFICKYKIRETGAVCLEIGSGRGAFQDMVENYTGVDYSESVAESYHKPFVSADARELPFENESFDFIWSYAVLEHIPDPEKALNEALRVLKTGGVMLLRPAWHCRPWAAEGYLVRAYSDFDWKGKAYKFLIPLLDSFPLRATKMFIARLYWTMLWRIIPRDRFRLPYGRLTPNYDIFWQSDSDACNDLDPYLTMLYLENKGCSFPLHKNILKRIFSTHDAVEIRKEN